jgi:hypothetical protein
MKSDLLGRVDEWVGMDIPAEGSEDYDSWQSMLAQIDAIENIQDVIDYVEAEGLDLDDFFLCGEYEVISAGLDSKDVPTDLATEVGELVAEQTWSGGSWVKVYLFDGKYFVVNEVETSVADTEADALTLAGIENDSFDQISHSQVHSTHLLDPPKFPATKKGPAKKARVKRRAVLVVVTDWPDGTMAMKFGGALRAALDVSKDDMNLVQMAPERIFRVETTVSEVEFREAMKSRDVASGGNLLFMEIPKT